MNPSVIFRSSLTFLIGFGCAAAIFSGNRDRSSEPSPELASRSTTSLKERARSGHDAASANSLPAFAFTNRYNASQTELYNQFHELGLQQGIKAFRSDGLTHTEAKIALAAVFDAVLQTSPADALAILKANPKEIAPYCDSVLLQHIAEVAGQNPQTRGELLQTIMDYPGEYRRDLASGVYAQFADNTEFQSELARLSGQPTSFSRSMQSSLFREWGSFAPEAAANAVKSTTFSDAPARIKALKSLFSGALDSSPGEALTLVQELANAGFTQAYPTYLEALADMTGPTAAAENLLSSPQLIAGMPDTALAGLAKDLSGTAPELGWEITTQIKDPRLRSEAANELIGAFSTSSLEATLTWLQENFTGDDLKSYASTALSRGAGYTHPEKGVAALSLIRDQNAKDAAALAFVMGAAMSNVQSRLLPYRDILLSQTSHDTGLIIQGFLQDTPQAK